MPTSTWARALMPGPASWRRGTPSPGTTARRSSGSSAACPTAQQQQSFDQAVLQRVQQTFQLSGISITLTENPAVSALHTLSVVSNSSSAAFPGAIGTTDLGANGFSFIDPMAQAAQSVDQLEWIVAHNISHELMLAFGVGENYDQTGNYIDARNANFAMMIDPNATFSAGAAAAIKSQLPNSSFEQVFQPGPQSIAPDARPRAIDRGHLGPAGDRGDSSPPPGSTARDVDDRGRGLLGDDDVLDVTSRPAPAGSTEAQARLKSVRRSARMGETCSRGPGHRRAASSLLGPRRSTP